MSAIIGLYQVEGRPVTPEALRRMYASVTAHGPDRIGCWHQGAVGLAQCQMIITPEDQYERQPLASTDGQLMLVSDARLDNRLEVAAKFRISAHEASTLPDSALILRAYERWSEDAPRHLIGDYAFALWDGRQRTFFLARSPLGNRPLYYHHTPRTFAFATMPNALFRLPWVPRQLQLENLLEPDSNCTLFQGLYKLPGGHWLRVDEGGLEEGTFWQLDLTRRVTFKRDEEYVEAFQERLTNAVESRLRTLYPVGISLSGGLDSSTVAAVAAPRLAQQNRPLYGYTQVPAPGFADPLPPGKYADETPYVEAIAARYPNLRPHFVAATDQPIFADIDLFFATMMGPFQNVTNRPWIEAIQAQAQADGVRVLLSGEAGNLTVSWKGTSTLPELVRQGGVRRAWGKLRKESRSSVSAGRRLAREGIVPLLPSRIQAIVHALHQGSINDLNPTAQPLPVPFQSRWWQARHREWWRQAIFPTNAAERGQRYAALLQIADGDYEAAYAARFGISRRDPTRDQRLVEFCFAVPESQWRRGHETRSLIRRSMAAHLPPMILYNSGRGLQAADWHKQMIAQRATLQADLAALARYDTVQRYLDLPRMQRLVDNLPQTGWNDSRCIADYQRILLGGLMLGHFIRWFETADLQQTPAVAPA